MTALDPEIAAAPVRLGLLGRGDQPEAKALAGGVSSDIWRVALPSGPVCVKRALARLKTAQEWRAPVERNEYEVAWLQTVGRLVEGAVPRLVAASPEAHLFVMEYLAPDTHALWKRQLRDGTIDIATAAAVGERLARIHAATARRADL